MAPSVIILIWDLSPSTYAGSDESHGIGKPFTLYDRRYYTDAEAKAILDLFKKVVS